MDFSDLILSEKTRHPLTSWLKSPAQTTILSGEKGVGLGTIARAMSHEIAGANMRIIAPYQHSNKTTFTIDIDDVRALVQLARGRSARRFAILIDEAEKLTDKAPQAALKLFEEPTKNLFFILTTHNLAQIPATIVSRSRIITVSPTEIPDSLLSDAKPASKIAQLKFLAGNLPAEMARLRQDEDYFRARAKVITDARTFLTGDEIDKMAIAHQVSNRDDAQGFVDALAKLLAMKPTMNFAKNVELLSDTAEKLSANANVKVQLLALATNIK